jgi:DNA-binding transcriptional LysR family regulator
VREVLAQKSVTMAANRLGITQPAVSQHVARFEKLTGIQVLVRSGNTVNVRSDLVTSLIHAIVEAEAGLIRLSQGEAVAALRLGICDDLAAYYCGSERKALSFSGDASIHVTRERDLIDLLSRGELDVVIRPLFHYEQEAEMVVNVPLTWIAAQRARFAADPQQPLPIIRQTGMSPYAYYVEQQLKQMGPYTIVAHIDDHMTRMHFVSSGLACALVPDFLGNALAASGKAALLPSTAVIRYGLFFNARTASFGAAARIFEQVVSDIAAREQFDASAAKKMAAAH